MSTEEGILDFLHLCENLKTTKRTGWINHQVQAPESIADHMHRMGVFCMLLPHDSHLDRHKIIKMAIVHDLAEAIVGDIPPTVNITSEEKHKMEGDAMQKMVEMLKNSMEAKEIQSLWMEYEEASTPEALFVKDVDKFEMIVQAFEYEKREGKRLEAFYASTKGKFKHPMVVKLVETLYQRREAHFSSVSA